MGSLMTERSDGEGVRVGMEPSKSWVTLSLLGGKVGVVEAVVDDKSAQVELLVLQGCCMQR